MEFWSVSSDGNGNFIIYPTFAIAAGGLLCFALAIIKTLIDGSAQVIYNFANNHTWIVLLIILIIIIAIIVCIAIFSKEKGILLFSIPTGISVFLSLSLVYAELIYWMGGFAEQLEKVFVIALIMSPVFLFLMLIQMALTLLLCAINFIPLNFIENLSNKAISILFTICTIVSNSTLIYFFCTSQLPKFILSSLR